MGRQLEEPSFNTMTIFIYIYIKKKILWLIVIKYSRQITLCDTNTVMFLIIVMIIGT